MLNTCEILAKLTMSPDGISGALMSMGMIVYESLMVVVGELLLFRRM